MVYIAKWEISPANTKKYRVILSDDSMIDFGDIRYRHYRDTTPFKLYSYLDHNDKKRRDLYYKRHPINYPKYSADWLSKNYLWK